MKQICVVDPSIKSVGGHYFSYADSLRDAAVNARCRFVIIGNVTLEVSPENGEVIPIFNHEFWDGHRNSVPDFFVRAGRVFSSRFGRLAAKMFYTDKAFSVESVSLKNCLKTGRNWPVWLMRVPLMLGVWLSRETSREGPRARRLQKYLSNRARSKVVNDLVTGMKRIIRDYSLQSGDIIFLPTCSENEVMAVLNACASSPEAAKVSWALLFRRPLYYRYPGIVDQDALRSVLNGPLSKGFRNRAKEIEKLNICFFTDAEKLSEQYEGLTGLHFATLPIPHTTHPRSERPRAGDVFRAVYVGDAREEKGYCLLPDTLNVYIQRYGSDGFECVFQSNYNIPGGEPSVVVAKARLRDEFEGIVSQVEHPLAKEDYINLLSSGDVNLLLYDEVLYRERSSGILAESLSMGVPCIVSSGTWLEDQVREYIRSYQCRLILSCRAISAHGFDNSSLITRMSGEIATIGKDVLIYSSGWAQIHVKCFVESADYVVFDFDVDNNPPGLRVEFTTTVLDGNATAIAKLRRVFETGVKHLTSISHVFRWPTEGRRFILDVRIINGEPPLNLANVRIRWLRTSRTPREDPLSSACVVIGCVDEIPEAINEVRRFATEYRRTALSFAKYWHAKHNAQRLVDDLLDCCTPREQF